MPESIMQFVFFFYRNIQVSAETLSKDRTQIYLMYFDLLTGD